MGSDERLVNLNGSGGSCANESKRIDIDVSRFKLIKEVLKDGSTREDNVVPTFDTFMDSTFGKDEGGRMTETKLPMAIYHSAVPRYQVGNVEIKLFYEKIGKREVGTLKEPHTFSVLIRGEKDNVEKAIKRVEKQKEIIEKTGRVYTIEDMTEIISIDATDLVSKRGITDNGKGEKERVDRKTFISLIHEEFIGKIFGECLELTSRSSGVLEETDGENIASGWGVKDVKVDLVSRVDVNGARVIHPMHVIITNKYPDNGEVFNAVCERVRTLGAIIETVGRMDIPEVLNHKYPPYNVKRLPPPEDAFGKAGIETKITGNATYRGEIGIAWPGGKRDNSNGKQRNKNTGKNGNNKLKH
jgi:hypothetical protein